MVLVTVLYFVVSMIIGSALSTMEDSISKYLILVICYAILASALLTMTPLPIWLIAIITCGGHLIGKRVTNHYLKIRP